MKIIIGFILIVCFTFCNDSINEVDDKSFELSETFRIGYHDTFFNSEENLSIKFDSLILDGRCPIDVVCVWEGDAELRYILDDRKEKIIFSLHTAGSYFTKDTVLLGYNIGLIDVFPYPHSEIFHEVESYEATILISKL